MNSKQYNKPIKNAKPCTIQEIQTRQQVHPKLPWVLQSKTSNPYNKPIQKCQTLHNKITTNPKPSQTKNANASLIKKTNPYNKPIQNANLAPSINPKPNNRLTQKCPGFPYQRIQTIQQANPKKPYNKPIQKCQILHNPRTPYPTTCESKNAKDSQIKELQTIQQANPKCQTLYNPRTPNPRIHNHTTSQM
jgi:hypothetical protein